MYNFVFLLVWKYIMRKILCFGWHSFLVWQYLQGVSKKIEILAIFSWFFRPKIFFTNPKNDPSRGNFMQQIDCAHFWSLKCFPDSEKLVHIRFHFNTYSYLPESGSRKHFQASGMRKMKKHKFFENLDAPPQIGSSYGSARIFD